MVHFIIRYSDGMGDLSKFIIPAEQLVLNPGESPVALGSGDTGGITGTCAFSDPHRVKMRLVEGFRVDLNPHISRGNNLEGDEVAPGRFNGLGGMYQDSNPGCVLTKGEPTFHSPLQWMRATCDFIRTDLDEPINIEVKCPSGFGFKNYTNNPTYYGQCQWQMAVTGIKKTQFCVFNGNTGLLEVVHEWDADEEVQYALIETGYNFLTNHIIGDEPIPMTGSKACTEFITERYPTSKGDSLIDAGAEDSTVIQDLIRAKDDKDDAEERIRHAQNLLKETIGLRAGIEGEFGKILWKTSERKTVDYKSLTKDLKIDAGTIKKYTKTKAYRTFRSFFRGDAA